MYARVVRFTDVDPDRISDLLARIDENDGPPEGVPATGLKVFHDAEQRTAVALQLFATAEDMSTGEAVLDAMDTADTPGTRVSVDRCEVKVEVEA